MRLNLPNHRCIQFEIHSDFTASSEKDAGILSLMNRTHTLDTADDEAGNPASALFGSRTRTGGVTHRVQGRLTRTPRPSDLRMRLSVSSTRDSDDLSKPPREFRPVSLLVETAGRLFGPIDISCSAVFEYDQKQGYKSKISFPIPLMFQGEENGLTHIESAEFSRRDNDEIDYQVIVMNSEESDSLVHFVSLESTVVLSLTSVKGLVDRARRISTNLLIHPGES